LVGCDALTSSGQIGMSLVENRRAGEFRWLTRIWAYLIV
jgi:hypothetical protein